MAEDDFVGIINTEASQKQKAKFFALCSDAQIDPEEAKERIKKRFNLDSFKDVTRQQLSPIIDVLLTLIAKKALLGFLKTFPDKESIDPNSKKPYNELLTEKLLEYFDVRYIK